MECLVSVSVMAVLLVLQLLALVVIYNVQRSTAKLRQDIAMVDGLKQTMDALLNTQRSHEARLDEQHSQHRYQHQLVTEQLANTHKTLQEGMQQSLMRTMQDIRAQLESTLNAQNAQLARLQQQLTDQMRALNGQVESRLNEGFAKTNQLFGDMVTRLSLIDQAQKKITELSTEVVGLQDILSNKQARGHFGEVQLAQLVANCLPSNAYAFQHVLSNGKRADAVLFLPEPSGNMAIDAKFPLENFRKMQSTEGVEKRKAELAFCQDMKTHIKDIASKYVDVDASYKAALLFLPAESIFAHVYDHHGDLVDFAYQHKVWLVSPTTLMAVLHTVQALLKDLQTQKQVHIIQKHLSLLGEDFQRFQSRMQQVAKHISDANDKVGQVHISAGKIVKRFEKIEQCELTPSAPLEIPRAEEMPV